MGEYREQFGVKGRVCGRLDGDDDDAMMIMVLSYAFCSCRCDTFLQEYGSRWTDILLAKLVFVLYHCREAHWDGTY